LAITVTGTGSNKVYDGTVTDAVTLASVGVLAGDTVVFGDTTAAFNNKTVGTGKTVSISGITASGADSGNYTLNASAATTANISPATLTETANLANGGGGKLPTLSGTLAGFVPGDTAGNSTTGQLAWVTDAPTHPNPGTYSIDGSGLTAANYVIAQAPANADALSITALPGLGIPQAVAGLIGLPTAADDIPTPFGVGSSEDYGNNTGNAKTGEDPKDNRYLNNFKGRLALTVVGGGVRLPKESIL
jgi:YDG domain/MBG domain (YGX type)